MYRQQRRAIVVMGVLAATMWALFVVMSPGDARAGGGSKVASFVELVNAVGHDVDPATERVVRAVTSTDGSATWDLVRSESAVEVCLSVQVPGQVVAGECHDEATLVERRLLWAISGGIVDGSSQTIAYGQVAADVSSVRIVTTTGETIVVAVVDGAFAHARPSNGDEVWVVQFEGLASDGSLLVTHVVSVPGGEPEQEFATPDRLSG